MSTRNEIFINLYETKKVADVSLWIYDSQKMRKDIENLGNDYKLSAHELEKSIENQVSDSLRTQIKGEISAFLNRIEVSGYEIETQINIDNDKNISIESIVIKAPEIYSGYAEKIFAYVKDNFNFEPQIMFYGDG